MVNFVICEFNPFHNGHAYLLERVHDRPTVCIMSGHVTQRGAFAFTDKWTRAKMALQNGADLVLELPAAAAAGSAMDFAAGAMRVAEATGFEGRLCFGTEGNVVRELAALARLPEEQVREQITPYLKQGLSPAAALMEVYRGYLPDAAEILKSPNNLLAFEYIKANRKFSVLTIDRKGSGHDSAEPTDKFASASYLRAEPARFTSYTPQNTHAAYTKLLETGRYLDGQKASLVILAALRDIPRDKWEKRFPGGLGARLAAAVAQYTDLNTAIDAVKAKNFTHSSVRRAVLSAYLDIPKDSTQHFVRVLGMNETGKKLLGEMHPTLPVLIKPAKVTALPAAAQAQLTQDARITDRFTYLWHTPQPKGLEYSSPIVL